MNPWEKKKWLAVVGIVLLCVGISLWRSGRANVLSEGTTPAALSESREEHASPEITVYISGAVMKPGLYQVKPGIRFQQALAAAGGVTEEADLDRVNLARKCKDGSQIHVPVKKAQKKTKSGSGKTEKTGGGSVQADTYTGQGALSGSRINLNRAGAEELERLPGIGPSLARKILEYRQKQPFARIEDLQKVKGIGPAKFLKLQDLLEV